MHKTVVKHLNKITISLFAVLILLTVITSCRDSAMDRCIDSKVEQGMSANDAREECEEDRADSQIRR
jgi:hypothetical protein